MTQPLKIALAGLGTVGVGVLKILRDNRDEISMRCGCDIDVIAVSARDRNRERPVSIEGLKWYDNAVDMATDPDVDVIVELIGGSDGMAKALCESGLQHAKHIVTANKALIAHHGTSLAHLAERNKVSLNYEAAVAGGIPIIKALRESFAGNKVTRLYGILNGTCNYILTNMRETGRDFDVILSEAQDLGYAEADPTFDVDGIDAAHKLAILTSLAYGSEVDFDGVQIEGIRNITPVDIDFAEELGYRIKLLGVSEKNGENIEQRVHPCMVSREIPIARVEDVFNAVVVEGDFVDAAILEGRGAGEGPTASAVVADIMDIARGISVPTFGIPVECLSKLPSQPLTRHKGTYYLRLMVMDRPGVLAEITKVLANNQVSLNSVIQRNRKSVDYVTLVATVHETDEKSLSKALDEIGALETVTETPNMIRIEEF